MNTREDKFHGRNPRHAPSKARGNSETLVCGGSSRNAALMNKTVHAIAVTPANSTIPKHGTAQFTATGTFSDSSTQDLTTQVSWSSSVLTVLSISNAPGSQGLATALYSGQATVTAAKDGLTGTAVAGVP